MALILTGAALFVGGVLFLAWEALRNRRLSEPRGTLTERPTLEPRGQKLRFLGIARNWIGLAMIAVGAGLLIAPL